MNFFQWICVFIVLGAIIYATYRFLTRNKGKMCAECKRKRIQSIDWNKDDHDENITYLSDDDDLSSEEDDEEDCLK